MGAEPVGPLTSGPAKADLPVDVDRLTLDEVLELTSAE